MHFFFFFSSFCFIFNCRAAVPEKKNNCVPKYQNGGNNGIWGNSNSQELQDRIYDGYSAAVKSKATHLPRNDEAPIGGVPRGRCGNKGQGKQAEMMTAHYWEACFRSVS